MQRPRVESVLLRPRVITIPSADRAFGEHVRRLGDTQLTPGALERRLRQLFPRVVVRERQLSGQPPAWYVYRDGAWRPPGGAWWTDPSLPRVVVSGDGWLTDANAIAAGILGIDPVDIGEHHFTDFVVPGTLEDALALFGAVEGGHELDGTIVLRPLSGPAIAVDVHASRSGHRIVAAFQLATDVDPVVDVEPAAPVSVATVPKTDVAFRGYVLRALGRMPEPTPDGLALRVRRLYPHATITLDDGRWVATRDPDAADTAASWWLDNTLPRVRYDAQALILEANAAAEAFLGQQLVGRYWQELVVAGSSEEVAVMLEILAEAGAAESRFRMPRADGTLIEFDSYTTVHGEELVTVMRAAGPGPRPALAPGDRAGVSSESGDGVRRAKNRPPKG